MVALAHGILEANERARQYFAISELRGRLRFGAAEDFVRSRLPEVLRDFTRIHRAVDLELRVDLSGVLFQALEATELDLVRAGRREGQEGKGLQMGSAGSGSISGLGAQSLRRLEQDFCSYRY
jgi:DNA-binding transcriptional LysR family regulator